LHLDACSASPTLNTNNFIYAVTNAAVKSVELVVVWRSHPNGKNYLITQV